MSKALLATAALVAAATIGASATDVIYSSCSDGSCTQNCQKTVVKSGCSSTNNGTSLTATYDDENVGLWHMDTYNNAQCTGAAVRVSGICNACSNGMNAMCGGLPGALMIRYNCPQQGNDECGTCADTIRLVFGTCTIVPNYKPTYAGYVYALVNWGCVSAGTTAHVSMYEDNTCKGAANKFTAPIGLCDNGKMFEVANSTAVHLK